jgi:hypothetical protein
MGFSVWPSTHGESITLLARATDMGDIPIEVESATFVDRVDVV